MLAGNKYANLVWSWKIALGLDKKTEPVIIDYMVHNDSVPQSIWVVPIHTPYVATQWL